MDIRTRLTGGNVVFRKNIDRALILKVATKAEPMVAILSCSDCRVDPEKIFNLSIGDAYVVRIAGNSASEQAVLGSLEYAVETLQVPALLVLGHTGCGAVKAAIEGKAPEGLVRFAHDIDLARHRLSGYHVNSADAVAEENVRLQMRQIAGNSQTIRDAMASGRLAVLGAMYDLTTGSVRLL